MFGIITYSCIIFSGASIFFYLEGDKILKNLFNVKYNKFKQINRLVATNQKGTFNILYISVCLVLKALWINIIQYMNNTVIYLGENNYLITYSIKGDVYKMIVKASKGPKKIVCIYDENKIDVSDNLFPYLGPDNNFHGKQFTPDFFQKQQLIFLTCYGDEKKFDKFDNIIL
jgi:hypothetical protein